MGTSKKHKNISTIGPMMEGGPLSALEILIGYLIAHEQQRIIEYHS